jgi:rhodanese-related sulfurtransferase
MNKKMALITSVIVLLFITFIVVYVNKSMAKSESMAGMSGDMKGMKSGEVHNIDQSYLVKAINKSNVTIVDIREPYLFEKSHIPNAINIPFADFESRFKELDSNKEIILVCHEGSMGEASGQLLLQNSFKHVSNLTGGMDQWSGPLEK